ncbi:hypothetical protein Tco_0414850 [Tanacetum coccineum]
MAGQAPPQGPIPDLYSIEELLQAPTDGVGDAIVVPPILANQFELKIGLLNLVTAIAFHANGNFLTKNTQEALTIIENKSKVQTSRNKTQVSSASGSLAQDAHVTALTKQRPQGALPSNTTSNPQADIKAITTRSGIALDGPSISPPPPFSSSKDVERDLEMIIDQVPTESTIRVPHLVVQSTLAPISSKIPPPPIPSSSELPKWNPHQPPIPYPSRLNKDKLQDKLESCMALADLGASINLMPLSVWKKLSLPDLTPTRITLELATRSIAYPAGIAEDVFSHLLRGFADELALLDPFTPGNENDNFDPEDDLRKIEYLLNQDPSIESSPNYDIEIIDPILKKFTDEPSLVYLPPLGDDDDDDDDLFHLKYDYDEWKKLLYGDNFNDIHSGKDKIKDSKIMILIDELESSELNVLPQLLTSDPTLPEESSESSGIATFSLSPFENKDKVFNPDILILGRTQVFNDESKDKDFKVNTSTEALLILEERNFLYISSDQELFSHLELFVTKTLLSFSSENEDTVFNPRIHISKGVNSFTLRLSHQTYETFKIINVHPNILNKGPMKFFSFFCFCPKDKGIQGESS